MDRYGQIWTYEQIYTYFKYKQICTDIDGYRHICTDIGLIYTDISVY